MNIAELSWSVWLGIALLIWLAYDLMNGAVYLHRHIERESEPMMYWGTIALWGVVAASCFIYR